MAKNKSDSLIEELRVFALSEIVPPKHIKITRGEKPYWNSIIEARARSTWNEIDLCHAATLATCLYDIDKLHKQMRNTDDIVVNHKTGVTSVHPTHKLIDTLVKRSISLSKMLHIHASGTQGRSRDVGERTKREKQLRDSQSINDLLAKPIH